MIEEVSRNEMLSTIHYMTEHFPYRLAGSPCEAAASRYVTERLKQYGLEVENKEFYTYNSDPMYSKVTVLEPEMEIDSLPCAHIRATKPEGEIFELIYVGRWCLLRYPTHLLYRKRPVSPMKWVLPVSCA